MIPYTCKIIMSTCIPRYVYMKDNYVNMQDNHLYMQDNYVYIITYSFFTHGKKVLCYWKIYVVMPLQDHRTGDMQLHVIDIAHIQITMPTTWAYISSINLKHNTCHTRLFRWYHVNMTMKSVVTCQTLITRFMGPTWDPPGANRTQVCPMLAPRTLLSGDLPFPRYQWCAWRSLGLIHSSVSCKLQTLREEHTQYSSETPFSVRTVTPGMAR